MKEDNSSRNNNRSVADPVVTTLYAVLVLLALVGLVAWSGADWYQRQEQARVYAHSNLRQAAGLVSELTIRHASLDTEALNRVFARTLGSDGRWRMVLLSSTDRGTEYYFGPRPLIPVDKTLPRWGARPISEVKVTLPVFRAQGDPMILEGIYEFYGRGELFSLLKACGLTLVILVVLTTMVVFLTARTRPETEKDTDVIGAADGSKLESIDSEPTDEEPLGPVADLSESSDEYWFDENLTLDDLPPLDAPPPPDESLFEPKIPHSETPVAPSLFSPATGMGWEAFLPTRLEHELQRCTEQNQDLSLLILAVKEGSVAPEVWGRAVREAFPSVDLDFEFEGGAAVVLPGKSLELALKAARSFIESSELSLGGAIIHAGAASRSDRVLTAQTLLTEGTSAKRRSLAGTVRVLGLKTDPERYREHIANSAAV